MERPARIELASPDWKSGAQPLSHDRTMLRLDGGNRTPDFVLPKHAPIHSATPSHAGALPLSYPTHQGAEGGLEPPTSGSLAGKESDLHRRGQNPPSYRWTTRK